MLKFKEGFYADARVETVFTTSIKYRDGALEESKNTTVKKAFLRVFDGEMWYYSSTYKLDDLQGELDKLYANATPNKDILKNETVKRFESNKDVIRKFDKNCVKDISIAEKGKMLTDKFALLKSEHFKMFVAIYSDKYSEIEFCSSKGADIKYDFQLCGIRFNASFADG